MQHKQNYALILVFKHFECFLFLTTISIFIPGEGVILIKYDGWGMHKESSHSIRPCLKIWHLGLGHQGPARIDKKMNCFLSQGFEKHIEGSVILKIAPHHHWNWGLSDACSRKSSITDGLSYVKGPIKGPTCLGWTKYPVWASLPMLVKASL